MWYWCSPQCLEEKKGPVQAARWSCCDKRQDQGNVGRVRVAFPHVTTSLIDSSLASGLNATWIAVQKAKKLTIVHEMDDDAVISTRPDFPASPEFDRKAADAQLEKANMNRRNLSRKNMVCAVLSLADHLCWICLFYSLLLQFPKKVMTWTPMQPFRWLWFVAPPNLRPPSYFKAKANKLRSPETRGPSSPVSTRNLHSKVVMRTTPVSIPPPIVVVLPLCPKVAITLASYPPSFLPWKADTLLHSTLPFTPQRSHLMTLQKPHLNFSQSLVKHSNAFGPILKSSLKLMTLYSTL